MHKPIWSPVWVSTRSWRSYGTVNRQCGSCWKMAVGIGSTVIYFVSVLWIIIRLNVTSQRKQLVLFFRESWCFPRRSRGKHQDSRENKTNWFLEGPNIKCFVIFLDFDFNSNKRITEANQNSRLGTYNNTNLLPKTTEWMIYKQKYFPYIICIFFLH